MQAPPLVVNDWAPFWQGALRVAVGVIVVTCGSVIAWCIEKTRQYLKNPPDQWHE